MDDDRAHTRLYKPLADLKYQYQSHSRPSTTQAVASTELPRIKQKERHHRDRYSTQSYRTSNTINDILKMKLEYGHIHDQISLIDLHMKENSAKQKEAVLKHERFVACFERFLSRQYDRVTRVLSDLTRHERKSDRMRNMLDSLRQEVVQKSLEIHELESTWRTFKVSQKFLLHIAALLQSTTSFAPQAFENFNVDPACETPTLDELVANFERHDYDQPFDAAKFEHVTAVGILDFLSKLKQQNLMLLRFNHEYGRTKDTLGDAKTMLESKLQDRESTLASDVDKIEKQIQNVSRELESVQKRFEKEVRANESKAKEAEELRDFVEALYGCCFVPTRARKSHLQMVACVEEHCMALLSELSYFEPHILKKVLRR